VFGFIMNGLFAVAEAIVLRRWPGRNASGKSH
jgi:hypothetical protein